MAMEKPFASIFLNNVPASWTSQPKCPNCLKAFIKTNPESHPFILPCSHSICRNCLVLIARKKHGKCAVCLYKLAFNKSAKITMQFDNDYYLKGVIDYKHHLPQLLSNLSNAASSESLVDTIDKTRNKCIECSKITQHICIQCNYKYCTICFTKLHATGVAFKAHQLIQLGNNYCNLGHIVGQCKKHNKNMDYFCQNCRCPICQICVNDDDHLSHETTKLILNNHKIDLNVTLDLLQHAQAKITESQKKILHHINKIDEYAVQTANNIFSYFHYYHSILQNLERESLISLKTHAIGHRQNMEKLQNTLETSNNEVQNAAAILKSFKKEIPHNVNLAAIHDETMCFLERLPSIYDVNDDTNPFSFTQYQEYSKFKDLLKGDIVEEQSPFLKYYFGTNENSLEDRLIKKTTSEISYNYTQQQLKMNETVVRTRRVFITAMKNPLTFYYQTIDVYKNMENHMNLCDQILMHADTITECKLNEMYLVSDLDSKWYRGIIKEMHRKQIVVSLIDYGKTITVHEKQLRPISDQLKAIPKMISEFSICNVLPCSDKWPEHCCELMSQLTVGNEMTTVFNENEENTGDLINMHLDYPASVRKTLLYWKFVTETNMTNKTIIEVAKETDSQIKEAFERVEIFTKQTLQKDETYEVKVMNIISPSEFYVTRTENVDEMKALDEKIQQHYNKGAHKCNIYYPYINMICCIYTSLKWQRARIIEILPNCTIEVFLVDVGAKCKVEWRYVRNIEHQFLTIPEGVALCSLVDIEPKDNRKKWNDEATIELKRLCKQNGTLMAFVCNVSSKGYKIELSLKKSKINFLINAWLAERGFAEWIGEGAMIVEHAIDGLHHKLKDNCTELADENSAHLALREFRRQMITVLYVISPDEFYISLAKYKSSRQKMHKMIQERMEKETLSKSIEWKVGDYCLVHTKLKNEAKNYWYRGHIKSVTDDKLEVYLRDYGLNISSTSWSLSEIDSYFNNVIDGAVKCHLANVRPTSTNWPHSAIDEFNDLISNTGYYDGIAVSVCGQPSTINRSLSVYLWGQKKKIKNPLEGTSVYWKNINELLVMKGYACRFEEFKTIVDCDIIDNGIKQDDMVDFITWYGMLNDGTKPQKSILTPNDDFILEADLDPNNDQFIVKKVTAWQSAKPIEKYIFTATPTYVDNNAVIYLHATSSETYLQQIKFTLNNHIANVPFVKKYKWKVKEPCMVKYHADECFYRGIVIEVMANNQYKVEFIDYGNVEICESNELREANILENIPIQASKYFLAYVRPANDNGIWDKKVLEFMHHNIVGKMVSVRVEDNIDDEYIPCSITVGPMNLSKILLSEKLAMPTSDISPKLKLASTYDFYNKAPVKRDEDNYKKLPLDQFIETTKKTYEIKRQKEYLGQFHDFSDLVIDDMSADDIEENETLKGNENEFNLSDFNAFDPIETSTSISKIDDLCYKYLNNVLPFKQMTLSKNLKKFKCKIVNVIDNFNIIIQPMFDEHATKFDAMEMKVRKDGPNMKPINPNSAENIPCLARYNVDSQFYRAVVKEINKNGTIVCFVDYLNHEIIKKRNDVVECPNDVLSFPLRNVIVRLHGLKANHRIRESDVKARLIDFIDKEAIVCVVHYDKIPSVHLYDVDNPSVLIYQKMIDMQFYKIYKKLDF